MDTEKSKVNTSNRTLAIIHILMTGQGEIQKKYGRVSFQQSTKKHGKGMQN